MNLPYDLIDGIGEFTIFANRAAADAIANKATDRAVKFETGENYTVVERRDGKFLIACIDHTDEVCWFIPAGLAG